MFQLRFFTGAMVGTVAGGGLSRPVLTGLVVGGLSWLCATWHIYLLNGLCDQTEDRHNDSDRPLVTGALPASAARWLLAVLGLAAVALGTAHSWPLAAAVLALLGLGWAYSAGPRPQKANLTGFVLVVTAGGLVTYLAGWLAIGGAAGLPGAGTGLPGWGPLSGLDSASGVAGAASPAGRAMVSLVPLLVLAAAMSLWMGLAGMTKDLADVAGDRAAGRRTLPVVCGDRTARLLMAALAIGVGAALCTLAGVAVPALRAAGLVLLAGATAVAGCLISHAGSGHRLRRRRPYRLFMATQYAVHAIVLSQHFGWAAAFAGAP